MWVHAHAPPWDMQGGQNTSPNLWGKRDSDVVHIKIREVILWSPMIKFCQKKKKNSGFPLAN